MAKRIFLDKLNLKPSTKLTVELHLRFTKVSVKIRRKEVLTYIMNTRSE